MPTLPSSKTSFVPSAGLLTFDPLGNLISFTEQHSPYVLSIPRLAAPKTLENNSDSDITKSMADVTLGTLEAFLPVDHVPETPVDPTEQLKTAKKIGILTSGGDSSGMNAAVRSITRIALQKGCVPYAIYEGYEGSVNLRFIFQSLIILLGLVQGGDKIKPLGWQEVRGFLSIVSIDIVIFFLLI